MHSPLDALPSLDNRREGGGSSGCPPPSGCGTSGWSPTRSARKDVKRWRAKREAGIPMDFVLPVREELARRDLEGAGVFDFTEPAFVEEVLRTIRSL